MNIFILTAVALMNNLASLASPVEVANNDEVTVIIDPSKVEQGRQEGGGRYAEVAFHYKEPVKRADGMTYDRLEVLYSVDCDERAFTSYKLAAYDGAEGERAVVIWTSASKANYTIPDRLSIDGAIVRYVCDEGN